MAQVPADRRPDVYVYGESLGALVGQAAVAQVPQEQVCGVLWSGAPGAGLVGHPHECSLLNPDDPIRYLSRRTALHRPQGWPTLWVPGLRLGHHRLDTGASGQAQWSGASPHALPGRPGRGSSA